VHFSTVVQIPLGSSRHFWTRHVRRVELVVSIRYMTGQVEFGLVWLCEILLNGDNGLLFSIDCLLVG